MKILRMQLFIFQKLLKLHFKIVVWDHIIFSVNCYSVMRLQALTITAKLSGDGQGIFP